jgi:hypothetical protein
MATVAVLVDVAICFLQVVEAIKACHHPNPCPSAINLFIINKILNVYCTANPCLSATFVTRLATQKGALGFGMIRHSA